MRKTYRLSAFFIAMSSAISGFAQDNTQTVEVTGSRIKSPGVYSNSPISSISSDEIKSTQPIAVEEVIRTLPSAVPAINPGVNNGTAGGATIDLRGLGPSRTLVLVDGRRMVPFDLNGRVDTNSIPISLLQRIDVVTGGASAVYGADAVSGVVNFVLRKNFQGLEASSSYGLSSQGDAMKRRTDITFGSNFAEDKGNIVFSFGKTTMDPLMVGARPIGQTTTSSSSGLFSGSSTTSPAVISVTPVAGVTSNTLGTGNRIYDPATGKFIAYNAAVHGFNTNPDNYFQTPLSQNQATMLANYSINDYIKPYAQVFYTHTDVNAQLAASGTFGNSFNIPIGSPFLTDAARAQICSARGIAAANCVVGNSTMVPMTVSRRFTELGPRYQDFGNDTFQTTVGSRGDFFGGWTYDAYFTSGQADQDQVRRNWGSLSKVQQAVNSLDGKTCVNPANGCVPINLFGADGTITQKMLDFVNLSAIVRQKVKQDVASFSTTGEVAGLKSPLAKNPVNLAFGLEKRTVTASNSSDGASQIQSEVLGTGAPTPDRSGTLKLNEVFAEAQIPLIQNQPMIHNLALEAGVRQTQFSTTSSTDYGTNKFGAEWAPMKGLRFRGMLQNATRAPNVNELFAPQVSGLSNLSVDPCQLGNINVADASKPGTLSALCAKTGVPATLVGNLAAPSSGQINQLGGGNPNLGPEKAKTTTLGFVFEPANVKNLVVAVDYYRINVTDAISSPSTTDILDQCYSSKFNPTFEYNASCAMVYRNTLNGTLNGVDSKGVFTGQSNQGKLWISGYDLNLGYSVSMKDLGFAPNLGKLDVNFNYNTVGDNAFQPTATSLRRDCKGFYSNACGVANFANKFNQRTVWSFGDYKLGYNLRHMSSLQVEPGSGTWVEAYSKVPSYNYVDLSGSWNYSKMLRLNMSVNNAFNKQPPLVGNTIATTSTNGGNTFPSTYDAIGRFITIGANLKF
ncbi:MAG: TonB-dependent receptor [Betaproteobacteria bacterium]